MDRCYRLLTVDPRDDFARIQARYDALRTSAMPSARQALDLAFAKIVSHQLALKAKTPHSLPLPTPLAPTVPASTHTVPASTHTVPASTHTVPASTRVVLDDEFLRSDAESSPALTPATGPERGFQSVQRVKRVRFANGERHSASTTRVARDGVMRAAGTVDGRPTTFANAQLAMLSLK